MRNIKQAATSTEMNNWIQRTGDNRQFTVSQ